MAHAFWKGTIAFGLVSIGVALRPARAAETLSFTLIDSKDFAPVGYKRYNKVTGEDVPWDRVVRGYEYATDQFVVLTDEELRHANAEASQTIEVVEFVDGTEIAPVYFDTPYFVEPQRGSQRSFGLLLAVLEQTGLVGIVRVVLRTRQHVAALLVHGGRMMLDLMRYEEELRAPAAGVDSAGDPERAPHGDAGNGRAKAPRTARSARPPKATPPSAAELKMATRLVEELRRPWKPERFRDEYRRDILALIDRKVRSGKTHEVVEAGPEDRPIVRQVVDLLPLLRKSLEESERAAAGGRARGRASRRPAAKAARGRSSGR